MSATPLRGRRVALTRAGHQNSELHAKLAALGAEVLELPLIEVRKSVKNEDLAEVFPELGSYDWMVFTMSYGGYAFLK